MPHLRLRSLLVVLVLAIALLSAGCSNGGGAAAKGTQPPKPPLNYVAVGASETTGTGADKPETQAWPRILADTLGRGGRRVTFTSLGFDGARVADALAASVPKAVQLQPNLVTVWLNVNDLIRLATAATFEQELGELVHRVRRGGATAVLLANTPALDRLPAYQSCLDPKGTQCLLPAGLRPLVPPPDVLNTRVDDYNQATARIAQREGAILVDLHAASLRARADGREPSLVSSDGFHPSTAGHATIAATFAEAAQKAGV